jgi:apolipoprotein N-acyltransferase
VTVALIDTDRQGAVFPEGQTAVALIRSYADQVPALAAKGAQVVVLPEKLGLFEEAGVVQSDQILGRAAKENQLTIVAGFHHLPDRNELRVYSPQGALEATYEKHHMLPPYESKLIPGTTRTLLDRSSGKWGLAICKDMDFPKLSSQYGEDGAPLLLVPAWDFVADGWLHGRMAILRGIESGMTIARTAKQGTLTLSDDRGRVLAQQITSPSGFVSLVATVPAEGETTFYDRTGDWFAWANLILFALLFFTPSRSPGRA